MITRIDRNFLAADLAAIDEVIGRLTEDDFATKMALESRREELASSISRAPESSQTLANASLFFSGRPVVGSRGIESEFGAGAIARFQEIVSTVSASTQANALGQRGPIAGKTHSKLHITNILHGSFGFRFEEVDDPSLFNSGLKEAVEQSVKLMASFDEADEDLFGETVADVDNRVIETIRKFFELVYASDATFRVVSDTIDKKYDRVALARAAERARMTAIEEDVISCTGQLAGVLPQHRTFEYHAADGRWFYGKVDESFPAEEVGKLNREWLDRESRASMRVKQILRGGNPSHVSYFLLHIDAVQSATREEKPE